MRLSTALVFIAEVKQPLGKGGVAGLVEISVGKDRPGWLRQYATGSGLVQRIADLHVDSHAEDKLNDVRLDPPAGGNLVDRLDDDIHLRVQLNEAIEQTPGIKVTALRKAVPGYRNATIDAALDVLEDQGNIRREQSGRSVKHYAL